MIYCRVGNCPVDNKIPLCCHYCTKRKNCPNACKQGNLSCKLAREVKEIKKELQEQPKLK